MGAVWQEEVKGVEFGKEVIKLSLFAQCVCRKSKLPPTTPKTYLNSYVDLVRLLDARSTCKNQLYFYMILIMNIRIQNF